MTGNRPMGWFGVRRRKTVAVAVAGWLSLALVLAFWPCCEILAQDPSSIAHVEAGGHDHDHGHAPTGDPCRAWLDTVDAALNSSPGILLSPFELKVVKAAHVVPPLPALPVSVSGEHRYHPSPPETLPLYLRVQHLLI